MVPLSPGTVLQRLESLQRAGVSILPRATARLSQESPPSASVSAAPAISHVQQPPGEASPTRPGSPPAQTREPSALRTAVPPEPSSAPTLEVLRQEVAGCTACNELVSSRTQTVFGVGNPRARLCLMGEAPGADEDRLGEPFVGRAGQLLNKMLEACGLSRDEVYILNVLKCRPPDNRNPTPDEARACAGFLGRQLDLIAPEFIGCLGAVAAQSYLATTTPIGRLRGTVHEHQGRKVVCTYHPAYLLRNPSAKRQAWEDLQLLMNAMGVAIPPSGNQPAR
ncbi:uracil-DNA glycosylase [Botrimarina hoheduenensis]|uniref:Type-4 uracil-DNA glycosylase n=1 Tax=Botrimarina hoheduenensis TaxID=2528000 RepID=A0A5C5WCI0_9BACT|nr:uracil-DNA glycosylase [Botrimarina hoheduenensis]TWT47775.1 Uracil DNA glycosylase superfamily protein [Botrimarina hoheduenensis]